MSNGSSSISNLILLGHGLKSYKRAQTTPNFMKTEKKIKCNKREREREILIYSYQGSPFRRLKVARYSFSGPIPPKFEHKLCRHKQSFGKTATTVVLDKDDNMLWSGLQRHRSCHTNEMTLLPILLAAVYLGTENCSSKIVHGSFFLQ